MALSTSLPDPYPSARVETAGGIQKVSFLGIILFPHRLPPFPFPVFLMPSLQSRRPARRTSFPYPSRRNLDRAVRAFYPELPESTPSAAIINEPPSFLGSQGQLIDVDNPLVVSSFRPIPEFPTFAAFNPSPLHPIPAARAPDPAVDTGPSSAEGGSATAATALVSVSVASSYRIAATHC